MGFANLTGDLHPIAIFQSQFCGGLGIHPQAWFIGILVEQLVVLRAKLGLLRHFAGQQVELIFA